MAHKTKIVKVLVAAFVGLNSTFLANTTFADQITNSGLVNQQLLEPRANKEELNQIAEAAKTNEEKGSTAQNNAGAVTLETFRKYLLRDFEINNGRKVDFDKNRDEANRLYDAIKKFEKENAEVSAQDFPSKIKNYINQKDANKQIEVLEDEEFKNKLKNNPDYLQLHYINWFSDGERISDIKKIVSGDFSNYSKSGLSADDGQLKVSGFDEKMVLGEFAVNSKKFNVLNAEHLDELIAILKYNHPEEMGFYKEIATAVDVNKMRKRIEKKSSGMSPEQQEQIFLNEYFYGVPDTLFSSIRGELDEIYMKITGSSLLDFTYMRDDIDDDSLIYAFNEKWPGHEKTIRAELYDLNKKSYYTNKTYEILRNRELLTKLLGYDALCDSSVVKSNTTKSYTIVNYNCLEFVNKNERHTPKPEEKYIPEKR